MLSNDAMCCMVDIINRRFRRTGVMGKITKKAIKSFQRENGLEANGIADSKTIQAIKDAAKQKD